MGWRLPRFVGTQRESRTNGGVQNMESGSPPVARTSSIVIFPFYVNYAKNALMFYFSIDAVLCWRYDAVLCWRYDAVLCWRYAVLCWRYDTVLAL